LKGGDALVEFGAETLWLFERKRSLGMVGRRGRPGFERRRGAGNRSRRACAGLRGYDVSAEATALDPIHQFQVNPIVPIRIGGLDLSFTNASLWMAIVVGVVCLLMLYGTRERSIVPSRLQAAAEAFSEFVASTLQGVTGEAGMRFFPLVFTIFMFVFASNALGLIPYTFTVTSQIVVTFALAILVIGTVVGYGVYKHGLHFFGLFSPSGVPLPLKFIIVPIEIISFIARPITLSFRLFANMLAGHITLKVFGGFVAMLLAAGGAAIISPLPLLGVVILTAFELLVAALQAYVFAVLTCVYLNDAIHPGH
jgi:F-type H+-transporting ATPase subunit a